MLIQCHGICCDEIVRAKLDTFQFRQACYEKNERPTRPKMVRSRDKHEVDIFALLDVIHGQRTCDGYHPHKGKRANDPSVTGCFAPQPISNFCAALPCFYNPLSSS